MRSWIFRHRLRLRVLYGPPPAPAALCASASSPEDGRRAGAVERTGRFVVLRPAPRGGLRSRS